MKPTTLLNSNIATQTQRDGLIVHLKKNVFVGRNDGIKTRIRMINILKTVGYRTYSDGVGATTAFL